SAAVAVIKPGEIRSTAALTIAAMAAEAMRAKDAPSCSNVLRGSVRISCVAFPAEEDCSPRRQQKQRNRQLQAAPRALIMFSNDHQSVQFAYRNTKKNNSGVAQTSVCIA